MSFSPLLSSKFVKSILIVMMGNGFGAVINYLYHPLTARFLPPGQFGFLESYIILGYFLSIATSAFSLSVIYAVNKDREKNIEETIRSLNKLAILLTIMAWLLVLIFYLPATNILKMSKSNLLIFMLVQVSFSFVPVFYVSLLAAYQKFQHYTLIAVLNPLLKVLFTGLFLANGFGLSGALLGLVISSAATALTGLFLSFHLIPVSLQFDLKISLSRKFWQYLGWVFLSQAGITALYTVDVLAVRVIFPQLQSGLYSATSTLTRSLFFLSTMICSVAFPMLTEAKLNPGKLRQIYKSAQLALIMLTFVGAAFLIVQDNFIVNISFGQAYADMNLLMPWFVVLMSLLGLYYLNYQYLLTSKPMQAVKLTGVAVLLQLIFIALRHQNMIAVIQSSSLVLGVAVLLSYLFSYRALYAKRE